MTDKKTGAIHPIHKVVKETEKSTGDQLVENLKKVKLSDKVAGLSGDEKKKAFELIDMWAGQMAIAKIPVVATDCTIEMDLMKGGHIKIIPPTGYNVMQGKRQMEVTDKENILPTYIMVSCAEIDGKPMAMHDLNERLTARDFNILFGYFCRLNLL
jgi:hypothetical protein